MGRKTYKIIWITWLLGSWHGTLLGQKIVLTDSTQSILIGNKVELLVDDTKTANEVLKSIFFTKSTQLTPNLGVTNKTNWIRFEITNLGMPSLLLMDLAQPQLDSAVLYVFDLQDSLISTSKMGDGQAFELRKYQYPDLIFEINLPKGETRKCLLKLNGGQQITLTASLGSSYSILKNIESKDLLFGIYCGIIFSMFFYNLFLFFSLKDFFYFLYVIYIFSVGILQACLEGYTFQFLWPNNPWLANQSVTWLSAISASLAMLFFRVFLQTKKYTPQLDKGLNVLIGIYLVAIVMSILGHYTQSYNIIQINAMVVALYLFAISIIALRKGHKSAKYFIISWSTFLTGVCVYVLKDFEILPYNMITNYTMQTGSALEVIFLSFALADRINILKKEKELSQVQALQILKENEKIIKEQNVYLEQKVAERTIDLRNTNSELSSTLIALKEAQSQLVNSEKMASLGQLTAGVAHEINNPINFVVSNVNPLRRDIIDLQQLLTMYDSIRNDDTIENKLIDIQKFKKEIDIDYVKEEIEILLKGITEGANRTAEIVQSLKSFSRVDEADLKKANVNDGLKSSIILLTQQLSGIELVLDYGDLPLIECFPGKLNQVFMNILTNAIEAIHSNTRKGEMGRLEVCTFLQNEDIVIRIKDSGAGMTEDVKRKIFDPFFTTKDVGKGTGLGLSITHGIIEKHKGSMQVESELGKGTEFIIQLPVNHIC